MADNPYKASLDIGTNKIALLVADIDDDERLSIIANIVFPSEGIKKGSIHSIDALSRVLVKIMDQLYKSYGFVVDNFGGQTSHLAWFLSFICLGLGSLFSSLIFKYYYVSNNKFK